MKSTHALLIGSCSLVLVGAGCGQPPAAPPVATPGQTTPAAPVAMTGNCNNPYYPLKKGTKASYISHVAGKNSTYSWEVTDSTNDSASITYTFSPKLQVTQDLNCGPDGLTAKTFLNMGAMAGGQFNAKTTSASGQFLPADLHPGSIWSSTYNVDVDNNLPAAARMGMKTMHMMVSTTNTAIGEESVTVPAGTFTAMKVESTMTMHTTLGVNIPPMDTTVTSYDYFVRGKGLVKSETSSSLAGSSSMEATSIETP